MFSPGQIAWKVSYFRLIAPKVIIFCAEYRKGGLSHLRTDKEQLFSVHYLENIVTNLVWYLAIFNNSPTHNF